MFYLINPESELKPLCLLSSRLRYLSLRSHFMPDAFVGVNSESWCPANVYRPPQASSLPIHRNNNPARLHRHNFAAPQLCRSETTFAGKKKGTLKSLCMQFSLLLGFLVLAFDCILGFYMSRSFWIIICLCSCFCIFMQN